MIPEDGNRPLPLLIVGLGNVLLSDDGLGVIAVQRLLEQFDFTDEVRAIDGGTLGLSLLPLLQSAECVILVDAVRADAPPGSMVRLEGEEVGHAAAHRLSVHQVGVADLLDGLRLLGGLPKQIVLLGLVPESIELGLERSDVVYDRLQLLVEAVAGEAKAMGCELHLRSAA